NEFITLQADWVIGPQNGQSTFEIKGKAGYIYYDGEPTPLILLKGEQVKILRITHFNVDSTVFPDGLKFRTPKKDFLPIGTAAPAAFLVSKGTRPPTGTLLARPAQIAKTSNIGLEPFNTGFAQYQLRGQNGVYIPRNVQIDLHRPIQHL